MICNRVLIIYKQYWYWYLYLKVRHWYLDHRYFSPIYWHWFAEYLIQDC